MDDQLSVMMPEIRIKNITLMFTNDPVFTFCKHKQNPEYKAIPEQHILRINNLPEILSKI